MRNPILLAVSLTLVACGTSASDPGADVGFVLGEDAGADTFSPDVPDPPPVLGDTGIVDAGSPQDATSGADATTREDAATGSICAPNTTWCDGDVLITCSADGDAVGRTRCSGRGLVCVATDDGASCAEPELPDGSCDAFDAEEIGPGEYLIDLCDQPDQATHAEQNDCGTGGAESGGDAFFTITVEEESNLIVDLRDEDGSVAIDTILYMREACEDAASQFACSDDIPCDQSDVEVGDCSRGLQVRQSRIQGQIPAGTYTVVVDHLVYPGFECGDVLLRLDWD